MMAYKSSMFLLFFNMGMGISNYIGTLIFPDVSIKFAEANTSVITSKIDWLTSFHIGDSGVLSLIITGGLLALFAFSLLIPTIAYVALFFSLNGIISIIYLDQFGLPNIFSLPLKVGIIVISFIGITQFMARSTVQGA